MSHLLRKHINIRILFYIYNKVYYSKSSKKKLRATCYVTPFSFLSLKLKSGDNKI